MYYPKIYKDLDIKGIENLIKKEGFNPVLIINKPHFVYPKHKHPQTKLLVFLKGNMEVKVKDIIYFCNAGDKLVIPGNTPHRAIVGENGCSFFWSEKII